MDDVEQLFDVILGDAREGDAQVGGADRNGADAVFFEQVHPQLFGIDAFEFQAHEIPGVEGVIFPGFVVLAAVEDTLCLERPRFHRFELFLLLGGEVRGAQGLDDEGLRRMRTVGDGGADDAERLLLQRRQNIDVLGSVAVGESDEPGPEPPDELLLGGSVELDGQHPRMEIGELAENRLLDRVLVEQAEIGVVGV